MAQPSTLMMKPKELVERTVYELHAPAGRATMDIVFFHGLQSQQNVIQPWCTTWRTADGHLLWPHDWLKEDLPEARVLFVCYEIGTSNKEQIHSLQDLNSIGEHLLHCICQAKVGSNTPSSGKFNDDRPIFLIGHSVGGLVIKQICCCASMRLGNGQDPTGYYSRFLNCVKGVFYYATPQAGCHVDSKVGMLARALGYEASGSVFKYLTALSSETARLNDAFRALRRNRWCTGAVAEKEVTNLVDEKGKSLFCAVVVDEASINVDLDYPLLAAPGTSHFTVCQPKTRTSPIYLQLIKFIETEHGKTDIPHRSDEAADLWGRQERRFENLIGDGGYRMQCREAELNVPGLPSPAWQPPAGLQGPFRVFWLTNIGCQPHVPWTVLISLLRLYFNDAMREAVAAAVAARPEVMGAVEACGNVTPLEFMLRSSLDVDGDGIVTVPELVVAGQRCKKWATQQGLATEPDLEQCLQLLATHTASELVLSSQQKPLLELRTWLRLPPMRTARVRALAAGYLQGSRKWILDELEAWRRLPPGKPRYRVFVLYGSPGIGKSTLAAAMVEQLRLTSAHHLCQHDDVSQSDQQLIVHSLAMQLSTKVPALLTALLRLVNAMPSCSFKDATESFEQLLLLPLQGMTAPAGGDVLVLVDALDELADGGHAVLQLMRQQLVELPDWVRFVVTSRPEPHIRQALDVGFKATTLEATDERHLEDLSNFIDSRLYILLPDNEALRLQAQQELLQKSEGSLLYAAQLLSQLEDVATQRPLSAADLGSFPQGLHGVYRSYFDKYVKALASDWHQQLMHLLEVLVAAQEPPMLAQLCKWLQLQPLELERNLLPVLGSLLLRLPAAGGAETVQLFHKSAYDWLVKPEAQGGYGVHADAGNVTIAACIEAELQAAQTSNMDTPIAGYSRYALAHGLVHLAAAALAGQKADDPAAQQRWSHDLVKLTGDMMFWSGVEAKGLQRMALRDITLCDQALQLAARDVQTADALSLLARLGHDHGQYQEVLPMHQRALGIREATLGPDHPDFAHSSAGLAATLHALGQYEAALPLHEQALTVWEEGLGPDHPNIARALNNVAGTLVALGRYEKGLCLNQRALAIMEKARGPDHQDTLNTLNNQAAILQSLGRYEEALILKQRTLSLIEKTLGQDGPGTTHALNNLAITLHAQGRYEEALALKRRALAVREKAQGPDHPDTATSLDNLAATLYAQGRFEEALPLQQRALAIRERALGPDHPNTARSLNSLGVNLHAQGHYKEGLPLKQRALAIMEKAMGPDHPDTAHSLDSVATTLHALGQLEEGLPLKQRALAIREEALGHDHPDTTDSRASLAATLHALKRYKEALPLQQRALVVMETAFGPDHPDTANSLDSLAVNLYALGRYEEGLPLQQRALAIKEKALGPNHPGTVDTLNSLKTILHALEHYEEAMQQHALAMRD